MTTQAVAAVAAAVPTVKTSEAVVWPELESAAVNEVVAAQPDTLAAVGAAEPDMRGTTRVTLSACASAATAVKE